MENDRQYSGRKYVLGGIAVVIILVYLLRLFTLQLTSDDFKRSADSKWCAPPMTSWPK